MSQMDMSMRRVLSSGGRPCLVRKEGKNVIQGKGGSATDEEEGRVNNRVLKKKKKSFQI